MNSTWEYSMQFERKLLCFARSVSEDTDLIKISHGFLLGLCHVFHHCQSPAVRLVPLTENRHN